MQKNVKEKIISILNNLDNVSRKDLVGLGLVRYLLHDKPFVAFSDIDFNFMHVKVSKIKKREYAAVYKNKITNSDIYESDRWIKVNLFAMHQENIADIISEAYKIAFKELSEMSQKIYTEKESALYDIDLIQHIKFANIKPLNYKEYKLAEYDDVEYKE